MKVKVNTDFERLQLKARDAINFIDSHPAINNPYSTTNECLWYSIQTVCKRGYCEDAIRGVSVYNKGENAKRFKKQFETERKEDEEFYKKYPSLMKIDVPYEELFGEPWRFDHISYWGELSINIYDPTSKEEKERDRWQRWCGVEANGRTFEEMMVKLAKVLRKDYGNFGYDSFMTEAELKNNKEEECFFFKPVEDYRGLKGLTEMISNPKFIRVTEAEKNIRWQKWMKYKKNKTFDPN